MGGTRPPKLNLVDNRRLFKKKLEVLIDYGSAFVTYGNEIESKGVQFPDLDAPDKINSTAWNEGAVIQDMRDAPSSSSIRTKATAQSEQTVTTIVYIEAFLS